MNYFGYFVNTEDDYGDLLFGLEGKNMFLTN